VRFLQLQMNRRRTDSLQNHTGRVPVPLKINAAQQISEARVRAHRIKDMFGFDGAEAWLIVGRVEVAQALLP
jgi:hypothetical protein